MASPQSLEQLKEGMRAVWMAGDFGKIAEYSMEEAETFVDGLGIVKGMQVLDVPAAPATSLQPRTKEPW